MERLLARGRTRLPTRSARVALVFLAGLAATRLGAEVVRMEILSREPFAEGQTFGTTGSYEKLRGRLHYAVDPNNPANARIVDLRLAPRDREGRVVFTGDFLLLKPTDLAKGNHRLLYEVNNRGNLGMLARFNRGESTNDPSTPGHAGNGFLLRQGYTLLWSAWNWDVQPGESRLQIELPVATENGGPITGRIVAEIAVNEPSEVQPFAWGNSRGYAVVDPTENRGATLTVRDEQIAPRVEIPRDQWHFADPTHLSLRAGFEPGRLYELIYESRDPRVVGLGLAAIRDTISFFRFAVRDTADHPNPLTRGTAPDPQRALIFGISQSGRVIQHILVDGLHVDEAGRPAFDAAMIHVSGGGKGSFNHRFAQTTRHPSEHEDHQYPADCFPFGTTPQTDPVTGETGDVLVRARAAGRIPYVFYTGTSTEYWARSASLLHTDVTGTRDTPVDEHARIYFIAGAQHGIGAPGERGEYANPANPLDHSPPLRALLVALDRWVSAGEKPPDSVYPRIDRGELVTVVEHNRHFPKVPGAVIAGANLRPPRLDLGPRFRTEGIVDVQPPRFGATYDTLVPDVDPDGNERAGIRLPDLAVPLGTYAGWNLRTSAMGASHHLARWSGSFLAFASTETEREQRGDPRPSIAARYSTQAAYVERVNTAAESLRRRNLLLPEDVAAYVGRARAMAWPLPRD